MTTQAQRDDAWQEDRLDPDNWLEIPDFGVMPADVGFEGFAFPIVDPQAEYYEARGHIRAMVTRLRILARKQFASMNDLLDCELADLEAIRAGRDVTRAGGYAHFYRMIMWALKEVTLAQTAEGRLRDLALAAVWLADFVEYDAEQPTETSSEVASKLLERLRRGDHGNDRELFFRP
jgi:hypothetical protein